MIPPRPWPYTQPQYVDARIPTIAVEPRVRVPEALQGQGVEVSATAAIIGMAFLLVLGAALHLRSRLATELKAQGALQAAMDAMREVVANANEQTRIAQQVNATQDRNAKLLLDSMQARITALTDRLVESNRVADERIAAALAANESRHQAGLQRLHGRIDALESMSDKMRAVLTPVETLP